MLIYKCKYDLYSPLLINDKRAIPFEDEDITRFDADHKHEYSLVIDDFEVMLEFMIAPIKNKVVPAHQYVNIKELIISVTDNITSIDSKDICNKEINYREIIRTAVKRVITFFKYELNQPFLKTNNPGWIYESKYVDEQGKTIKENPRTVFLFTSSAIKINTLLIK